MKEDAPQREHSLRKVFNGLRYIVRTGAPWHMMPNDLPPVAYGLPADAALAEGRGVRGDGPRPADADA
jgi:transposase